MPSFNREISFIKEKLSDFFSQHGMNILSDILLAEASPLRLFRWKSKSVHLNAWQV